MQEKIQFIPEEDLKVVSVPFAALSQTQNWGMALANIHAVEWVTSSSRHKINHFMSRSSRATPTTCNTDLSVLSHHGPGRIDGLFVIFFIIVKPFRPCYLDHHRYCYCP